MNTSVALPIVPFREVRHFQPDDCLHYEPIEIRGRLHEWTIPVHRHEALHQFHLLASGSVVATIDGVGYSLTAPAAWMIAPGVVHGFVYERDSTGHVVSVPSALLRGAEAQSPNLARRLERTVVVRMSEHDCIDLCRLIEQIAREFHDQQPGRTEALRAHATLLGLWFVRRAAPSPAVAAQVGTQDPLVERYRMLIEANYRKHWPVRAYAAALAVTPDHLSRRCRAATGLGALDMAQERLLVEARRLLAYTPTTVTEIAHHLGFEDPAYFSRLFTRSTGQSPSTYRAAMADGLGVPPLADTAPPERPPDL